MVACGPTVGLFARPVGSPASVVLTRYDADLGELALLIATHFRYRVEAVPRVAPDRLAMPVLLLAGGRDVLLSSYESARLLERFVPTATVRLLPEVGHVLSGQTTTVLEYLRGD